MLPLSTRMGAAICMRRVEVATQFLRSGLLGNGPKNADQVVTAVGQIAAAWTLLFNESFEQYFVTIGCPPTYKADGRWDLAL